MAPRAVASTVIPGRALCINVRIDGETSSGRPSAPSRNDSSGSRAAEIEVRDPHRTHLAGRRVGQQDGEQPKHDVTQVSGTRLTKAWHLREHSGRNPNCHSVVLGQCVKTRLAFARKAG